MKKICLITLGCPKNIVEGEHLAGMLREQGWGLTTDLASADCALVHTCSFIADARNESTDTINALVKLKEEGRLGKVIVTGCLVQGEGKKIAEQFPGVDGFTGTGDLDRIAELLAGKKDFLCTKAGGLLESGAPRLLSSNLPSAYLRIAEGCNHRCSFCVIPQLRGRYVSRTMNSIVEEAQALAANGIEELILIAQDTTWYGRERYGAFALPKLLRKLGRVDGIRWLRLMYAYPSTVSDELLRAMAETGNVCRYIDMPLQHASAPVLKRMGRPSEVRRTLEKVKRHLPDIALRSTFIVGFPGETENEFRELYDLVAEGWFEHLGVFEYSAQEGSRAARLPGQVAPAVKRRRNRELMLLQKKIATKRNKTRVGTTAEVLVEGLVENEGTKGGKPLLAGRTAFQAPEIDGRVLVEGAAVPGTFVNVEITGAATYDLLGKVVKK